MLGANIETGPRRQQAAGGAGGEFGAGERDRTVGFRALVLVLSLCTGLTACDARPTPHIDAAADSSAAAPVLTRETIFVGQRGGEPLVSVFAYRTIDGTTHRSREVRAWLGHGSDWETFLDERWSSGAHGSAWSVVPHGPFRVAAGGPAGIEAVWFRRGGRNLRLALDRGVAEWVYDPAARVNLFTGDLTVGGEAASGLVMELLRLRRPGEDPPGTVEQLLLTSGDSLALMLSAGGAEEGGVASPGIVWLRSGAMAREWDEVRISTLGGRPVPEARREIPRGWEFAVPGSGVRGEVRPLAFTAEVGIVERTGRRGIEARYTVKGWLELDGRRLEVTGFARHVAE